MKKRYFLLVILFFSFSVFSQNSVVIKGKILDKNTQVPLEAATVYLTTVKDSTVIDYTITDKNGFFKINTKKISSLVFFKISYVGYQTFKQEENQIISDKDYGIIRLSEITNTLGEVVIKSEAPPIRIKKDTLEFNASSFKVRPDSNVETLLKQLPGVEVSPDGKVTVNGKEVNQVLVNGKPFFDKDGKIALQSLPSDIINKVQISDTKTRKEEVTNQAASTNNASINLTIDENKNKGLFGKFMAGYGTDNRYESSALINYFKGERKISVLASSNNINSTGFSMDEVFDNMGGGRNSSYFYSSDGSYGFGNMRFGGGKGITRSNMVGVNYGDEWFKDFDSNTSYFFTNSNAQNTNTTKQINLLPTGDFTTQSNAKTNEDRFGHNVNFTFEYKIDSTASIFIAPKFVKANTKFASNSSESSRDQNNQLLNENVSNTFDENDKTNFTNSINFNKAFKRKGRSINVVLDNDNSTEIANSLNKSTSVFYQNGTPNDVRNQNINNRNLKDLYASEITFLEPISDSLRVSFNVYGRTINDSEVRKAFDYDKTSQKYSTVNDNLTNTISSTIRLIAPKMGFAIEKKKFNLNFASGTNVAQFDNQSLYLGTTTKLIKKYIFPYANFYGNIRLGKSKSIWAMYDYTVNFPRASQLLPIENIANPLNTFIGNSNLELIKNHSINFSFNDYDYATRSGYYIYSSAEIFDNQIVSSTLFNDSGKRTTTFENVSGTFEYWFGANWNKTFKKEAHTFKFQIGSNAGLTKSKGFTNGDMFVAHALQISPRANFTYEYGELLTINPSYTFTYNDTRYTNYLINSATNVLHTFNIQTTNYWPKNWVFGNDFGYTYNSNIADGFKKDFYLWNTSLAYHFFNKKMSAKVKVYDVLNQNQSVTKTITPTTIRDEENTVLRRYMMFSLTYKIEKFAGKEKPSMPRW
ncbi:outer membrane beta-barrel protein [Flavobacterium luteum]|uniref:Outer membrane beta-barrel protein n=1 Tax=Flavobacterium luteum TaxID=2026654 RepID=A0A7J5AG78_9FLAO|nr:outer membrane beta-barrel protein [Flavobacterium luteum]KAB1156627.1 outer membrane beta-barrel protein [Flavobacterium luteum]